MHGPRRQGLDLRPPRLCRAPPQPRAVPQFPRARSPGGEWGGDGQSIPGGGSTPVSPSQGTSRTASHPPASLCQLLNPRGVILGWGRALEGCTSSGPQGAAWGCSVAVGALCVPPRGLHEAPLSVPKGSGVPPRPRLQPLGSATTGHRAKGAAPPPPGPFPSSTSAPSTEQEELCKGTGASPIPGGCSVWASAPSPSTPCRVPIPGGPQPQFLGCRAPGLHEPAVPPRHSCCCSEAEHPQQQEAAAEAGLSYFCPAQARGFPETSVGAKLRQERDRAVPVPLAAVRWPHGDSWGWR